MGAVALCSFAADRSVRAPVRWQLPERPGRTPAQETPCIEHYSYECCRPVRWRVLRVILSGKEAACSCGWQAVLSRPIE